MALTIEEALYIFRLDGLPDSAHNLQKTRPPVTVECNRYLLSGHLSKVIGWNGRGSA